MQAIRKRNPFTFQSEDHGNGRIVLDEQGNSFTPNDLDHTAVCSPTYRTGRGPGSNQGTECFIEQAEPDRFTSYAWTVMYTVRHLVQSY